MPVVFGITYYQMMLSENFSVDSNKCSVGQMCIKKKKKPSLHVLVIPEL